MDALKGRVAIITGAGTGIGRATAGLLAAEGASVVLAGRRQAVLDEAAADIGTEGGIALALSGDISKQEHVEKIVAKTMERLGPVDILINNAGSANRVRNIRWIDRKDWDDVLAVNLTAVYLLTKAVLPGMLEKGGGTIVTISSLAALRPNLLGGAPYGAAKAGVRNLMAYLHNTFRNQMIRATTILPGEVNTPIMDDRARPPTAEEREAMVQPDDVARAVLLCCTLPQRTVIEELVIAPTRFRDPSSDIEISRWIGAPAEALPPDVT